MLLSEKEISKVEVSQNISIVDATKKSAEIALKSRIQIDQIKEAYPSTDKRKKNESDVLR